MNYVKSLSLYSLLLFLCHCATDPEPVANKEYLPKSQSSYVNQNHNSTRYNDIDLNALLDELNMNHPLETLGFQEQAFDTCQVSSNRSKTPYCQKLYVARLNFQVMCRDSTGTVEKVNLTPLTSQRLRWKRGRKRGLTSTNSQGYGSLGFVTRHPSKNGHLYLYLGSKIARKRFLDKWKLILPKSWCLSQ